MTDELDDIDLPKPPSRWPAIVAVTLALGAFATVPMVLGFGWFGARLVTSAPLPVHVLNTSGQPLTIEVDFASPVLVPPGRVESLESLTGDITLVARAEDGSEVEREVISDAQGAVFYNALGSECLAVFDLTGLYGGSDDEAAIRVVERVQRDQRIVRSEADVLLLPRRTPPDTVRGTVHWIEVVGCNLLDPAEEEFLLSQAQFRLENRRAEYEALREMTR